MQDQNLNFIEFPYFDDLIQLQIYATGNENLLNDNIERIAKAKGPLSRRVVDDRNTLFDSVRGKCPSSCSCRGNLWCTYGKRYG